MESPGQAELLFAHRLLTVETLVPLQAKCSMLPVARTPAGLQRRSSHCRQQHNFIQPVSENSRGIGQMFGVGVATAEQVNWYLSGNRCFMDQLAKRCERWTGNTRVHGPKAPELLLKTPTNRKSLQSNQQEPPEFLVLGGGPALT